MFVASFVFQTTSLAGLILFLKLSKEWPDFVKEWHLLESIMKHYDFTDMNLRKYIKIILITILTLAAGKITATIIQNDGLYVCLILVEHFLLTYIHLKKAFSIHQSVSESFRNYYVYYYSTIFLILPYNIWTGVFFEVYY